MNKSIAGAVAALLVGGSLLFAAPASATEVCVPSAAVPAYTEVTPDIEHPAVYETVVITPAVEGTPAIWANFSPNDYEGTFIGPATYPDDERGTWHDHGQLPPGQAGPDGVYANGNPDKGGNWFYRQAEVPVVEEVTEERLVTEAYIEDVPDIFHPEVPAVTCPGDEDPVIEPRACAGVGAAYTEGDDLAPVATPEGLRFDGGSGQAVGIRWPVSGNLQGWSAVSFTNTGGQSEFFFRIVIDASADGGPAYKSLSFPGYSTVDQASISYQYGESIAATAERFPNAVITSVGFQTNSGAVAGYSATLVSVSGPCVSADFTYTEEPPVEEPPAPPAPPAPAAAGPLTPSEPVAATLAATGSNTSPLGWVAGALALLLGAVLVALNLVRGRRSEA